MKRRTIPIFVSSTFGEFASERQHLARVLLPRLGRRFRGRRIDIELWDFRWGITEEQLQEESAVSLCLDYVKKCDPLFIGFIGNRYGSVLALREADYVRHPWLRECDGQSITALEFRCAILNNSSARGIVIEKLNGEKAIDPRVEALRLAVDSTETPILRKYSTLDELTDFIEHHLVKQIDSMLVQSDDDDSIRSHLRTLHTDNFVGRTDEMKALTRVLDERHRLLWVSGPKGCGKSALLAASIENSASLRSGGIADYYYPADDQSGSMSIALAETYRKCAALAKVFTQAPPTRLGEAEFFPLLHKLALNLSTQGDHITILWDNPPDAWLNRHWDQIKSIPERIGLVVCTREPKPIREPPLAGFDVRNASRADLISFVVDRLARTGKKLSEVLIRKITATPASASYHYMTALLDELTNSSAHDKLAEDIDDLLRNEGVGGMLDAIVARTEGHLSNDSATLFLQALYYYGTELSEHSVCDILQLPDSSFASLKSALAFACYERDGRIGLNSTYRVAVRDSMIGVPSRESEVHAWLAARLLALTPAQVGAAVEQYGMSGRMGAALDAFRRHAGNSTGDPTLLDAAITLRRAAAERYPVELAFWEILQSKSEVRYPSEFASSLLTLATLCDQVLPGSEVSLAFHDLIERTAPEETALRTAAQHRKAVNALSRGNWTEAVSLSLSSLLNAVGADGPNARDIPFILSTLSAALDGSGRPRIAECFLRGALAMLGDMDGLNDGLAATLHSNLGQVFKNEGRLDLAVQAAQRSVLLRRKHDASDGEALAKGLHNLGALLLDVHDYAASIAVLREAYEKRATLQLASRANTASSLILALIKNKEIAAVAAEELARTVLSDASIPASEKAWLEMTCADAWLAQDERERAIRHLESARARALGDRGDWVAGEEADYRLAYVISRTNWTRNGRFRGWPRESARSSNSELLWKAFADTSEYARFFLRNSLSAVASDKGSSIVVVAKGCDVLARAPIGGLDLAELRKGLGPPEEQSDLVLLYTYGAAYLACWVPIVRINHLSVAALNAIVAALAYTITRSGEIGQFQAEPDEWVIFLRKLVKASHAATGPTSKAGAPTADPVSRDGDTSRIDRAIAYFPRLTDFKFDSRAEKCGFIFTWLSEIESSQSIRYHRLLWVERPSEMPIIFSRDGNGLGGPVLVISLEVGATSEAFFCAFTRGGHQNLGVWNVEGAECFGDFKARSTLVADELLGIQRR